MNLMLLGTIQNLLEKYSKMCNELNVTAYNSKFIRKILKKCAMNLMLLGTIQNLLEKYSKMCNEFNVTGYNSKFIRKILKNVQ